MHRVAFKWQTNCGAIQSKGLRRTVVTNERNIDGNVLAGQKMKETAAAPATIHPIEQHYLISDALKLYEYLIL